MQQAAERTGPKPGSSPLPASRVVPLGPSGVKPPRPSAMRMQEERERRHRERTIAAWLRSLSR
jgi:hypothetical protein